MNIKSYLQIGLVIIIVIILSVFYYSFLKQNNTKPEVSLRDGLISVAIGEAAEKSIKENRVVFMKEFKL